MAGKDLISHVSRRLTMLRWVNLCLCILAVCAALIVVFWAQARELIPSLITLPLVCVIAIGVLYLFEKKKHWWKKVADVDAAKLLDSALHGQDRFLTLATLSELKSPEEKLAFGRSLRAVERQIDSLAQGFQEKEHSPFALETPARISAASLPPLLLALGALAWFTPADATAPLSSNAPIDAQQAEQLRDLTDQLPSLPTDVKDELLALADTVEENGLSSPESLESLNDALHKVEDKKDEVAREREAEQISDHNSDSRKQQNEEHQSQESQSAQTHPEKSPDQKQTPKDSPQESKANADKPQQQQEQQGDSSSEQAEKQASAASSEKASSEDQQGQKDSSQKQQEGGSGQEEGKNQGSGQKSQGQKEGQGEKSGGESGSKSAHDDGKGSQPDDPRKDQTGVGSSQGKGKPGEQKELGGESQSGSHEDGAKDGKAENDQQGKGSDDARTQQEDGKTDKDQTGKGKENGPKSQSDKAQSPKEDPSGALKKAEQKLQEMKNQAQSGADSKDSNDKGSDQGQGKEGEKENQSQQGSKKSDGKSQGQKSEENSSGDKKNSQGGGKQQSQDSKSGKEQSQQESKNQDAQSDGQKGDMNTPQKSSTPKSGEGSSKETQEERNGLETENGGRNKSNSLPKPNEQAQRFGPFDGGKDGELDISKSEKVKLEVSPSDEKIVVRSLGQQDGKVYRNPNEARSKTALGATEFVKPEADAAKSNQPIPVEYKDLLR